MYCQYLNKSIYDVHYVGFDEKLKKKVAKDVSVYYVPIHKNKIVRYLRYICSINSLIRKGVFDVLFLVDCQGSLLIRFCNLFRKSILDIRTGDTKLVNKGFSWFNMRIRLSSLFFKHITIISDNLRMALNLPQGRCHFLPLGGNRLDLPDKTFNSLSMLYIGTLNDRKIFQTIEGLSLLILRNSLQITIEYNIVGFGSKIEELKLKESIVKHHLETYVIFHGRKSHDEISFLFNKSNLGVVYIPIIQGYNCQPTTKLYEYLLAGMPVIATSTLENKLAVGSSDGILIQDSPEDFCRGLEEFLMKRNAYDSPFIKSRFRDYEWENIVKYNLQPYLDSIC